MTDTMKKLIETLEALKGVPGKRLERGQARLAIRNQELIERKGYNLKGQAHLEASCFNGYSRNSTFGL